MMHERLVDHLREQKQNKLFELVFFFSCLLIDTQLSLHLITNRSIDMFIAIYIIRSIIS
jgi:hypothetical protein